ncbi:prephenate dehydrogenase/arogenate dehydrogenase family protein, partial [bacterium]|nr:prephenate dehydrogenase/arogenate dehydrogenase family protein [bacterium]
MTVAIFGLGLIGGSIGRNLVKNSDYKVLGYDIDNATM